MKYTLLQMTQEILSSMDGDEISSITDTSEATQVAHCIRQAYYDLIEDLNPPEHYSMFEVTESSGSTPVLMTMPSDINKLMWVKYNKITSDETVPNYADVTFMGLKDFLTRMYMLNTDEDNIETFEFLITGGDSIAINCINDRAPLFYTVLGDDYTLLFDAYDSEVETYLRKSKTVAFGKKSIDFAIADGTTPDLDEDYFSRLLNEAKVLAFAELKQIDHALANRNAKRSRQRSFARKNRAETVSAFNSLPNFGRIG